jgi:hypothetical protein
MGIGSGEARVGVPRRFLLRSLIESTRAMIVSVTYQRNVAALAVGLLMMLFVTVTFVHWERLIPVYFAVNMLLAIMLLENCAPSVVSAPSNVL